MVLAGTYPAQSSPGVGVPGGEAWWLLEGHSAVVSVSMSMSVSRSVCIRVRVQPRGLQYPLPHSAALSAFPLNTTPLPSSPRHLGKLSRPLMRSHMLMSSDVSGIPSFLPPPLPLCRFPLRAHTLQSLVKT